MNSEFLEPYKSILESIQGLLDKIPDRGVIIGELRSAFLVSTGLRRILIFLFCCLTTS